MTFIYFRGHFFLLGITPRYHMIMHAKNWVPRPYHLPVIEKYHVCDGQTNRQTDIQTDRHNRKTLLNQILRGPIDQRTDKAEWSRVARNWKAHVLTKIWTFPMIYLILLEPWKETSSEPMFILWDKTQLNWSLKGKIQGLIGTTQKIGIDGNPFYAEKRPGTTGHLQVTLRQVFGKGICIHKALWVTSLLVKS